MTTKQITIHENEVSASEYHQASPKRPVEPEMKSAQAKKSNLMWILFYFFAWFFLSTGYNIFNKRTMNAMKLPWIVGTIQVFAGIPIFSLLWLSKMRKSPVLNTKEIMTLIPIGMFHCGCHIFAVLAMSAGSVSFAHIIKAGEPITTAILSGILLKEVYAWQVYLALIPVITGVSIASMSEPSFSFFAFLTAMGSNMCSSLRAVYSKQKMSSPIGQNLDARNLYGILTIISFCILAPLALIIEGPNMSRIYEDALLKEGVTPGYIMFNTILSSLCYYFYNEVAFSALELVSPVTHAVGSTFKRVFIIGGSIIAFKNYPDATGYVGITIAIAGVGVYSLAKQKFKRAPTPVMLKTGLGAETKV